MSKLNEAATNSSLPDLGTDVKTEGENSVETNEDDNEDDLETKEEKNTKTESDKKDILKFTMLFNKYSCVLEDKRNSRSARNDKSKRDIKSAIFFNKEVTIRRSPETPTLASKILEVKKLGNLEKEARRPNRTKTKLFPSNCPEADFGLISHPGMAFSGSLSSSSSDLVCVKSQSSSDSLKAFLNKTPKEIDSLMQLTGHPDIPKDLKLYKSLTILTKNNNLGFRGTLRSKIPSLTALDSNWGHQKSGATKFSYWDHWDDLILMQSDVDKRLNLQISRSSYDSYRRCASKFKKEDAASVSDSKLLCAGSESKTHIKKCDKKSRGDSSRKERESGNRKQVQWNTEVDVIYFSIQMAANGDRSEEVIGRVMEPLREEWEQQRKGFYAKMVPSQMESHIKDRFISLLKI